MGVKSKLISALFSTLFMGVYWLIKVSLAGGMVAVAEEFMLILVIMLYTGIGTFVYGIPVSFLSDWLSNKVPSFRFMIAAFVHVSLAVATILVLEQGYVAFAIMAAVFFFAAEEWQHRKQRTIQPKPFAVNTLFVLLLLVGIWSFNQMDLREKTHRDYLIPEGYEGMIVVMYERAGAPKLSKEDGQLVIPISKEEIVYTSAGDSISYGEAKTSSEMPQGINEDMYYYVDDAGKRTPIRDECLHLGKSGLGYLDGEEEIEYEILQVTTRNCGLDFMRSGRERYEQQEYKVMNELSDRQR